MYNKHEFNKINDKKVLHKVKKQWITISLALLMMIGGAAVATRVSVSADSVNQPQIAVASQSQGAAREAQNNSSALRTSASAVASSTDHVVRVGSRQNGNAKLHAYHQIKVPYTHVQINRPVILHSSLTFRGRDYGTLSHGQIVKIDRAFREAGRYGTYLRYEVPLIHKRNAFITGNVHFVSYVAPSRSVNYYRGRINNLLKKRHGHKWTSIRRAYRKLSRTHRRVSYRHYMKLYFKAFDLNRSVRHHINHVNDHETNATPNSVNPENVDVAPENNADVANVSLAPVSSSVTASASNASQPSLAPATSFTPASFVMPNSTSSVSASSSVASSAMPSSTSSVNSISPVAPSSSAQSSEVSSVNSAFQSAQSSLDYSIASSAASVADQSIVASYRNSVAKSVSVANVSTANSYAESADQSVANSYRTSVADSVSILDQKIANSYAESADQSIAGSYRASVATSVSALDRSLAQSAASVADQAIANSVSAVNASEAVVKSNLAEIQAKTYKLINAERQASGVKPVMVNKALENVANERAQQLSHNFSHFDNKSGHFYLNTDLNRMAPRLANSLDDWGENISMSGLGPNYEEGYNNQDQKDNTMYNNQNGNDMANMMNDGMMNYDANQQNGHRKNILSSGYNIIGIGAFYDPANGHYYLSEDFGHQMN